MAKSIETRKYLLVKKITKLISLMLTLGPLLFYVLLGLINNEVHEGDKLFLGMTVICAIILTLLNVLFKHHLRSPFFLLILGLYFALKNITPLLICVSIGTCLDEFIVTPIYKRVKNKAIINGEIDKRL